MPLKRHPALQDLSRDHHHFLLQARNIKWLVEGHDRAGSLKEVVDALLEFWDTHGEHHLREEETLLYPLYLQHAPTAKKSIDRLERDHEWLRDKVAEIRDMPHYENCDPLLRSMWQYIEGHVRHEERVVYEDIQKTLDEATLQDFANQSVAYRREHRPDDAIGRYTPRPQDDDLESLV